MLSRLVSYGNFGNLYCGVEHAFINGQEKLNILLLKKKKSEFLIKDSLESNTVSELSNQLQKGQHLFLIINNEKVLFKNLDGIYNTQKAIVQAFPNLKVEDFYCEVYTNQNNTFIAICRKDYINNLIKEYHSHKLNVVDFSLGNLAVSQLTNFINEPTVETSNSIVSFANQKIKDIMVSATDSITPYTINGLEITKNTLLALAGIISYYSNQKQSVSNFDTISFKLNNDFKQKRIFDLGLKAGLALVFVLLLISFLFFSSYTSKINQLNVELELNKTHKKTLLKLSDDIQKKEQLVNDFSSASSKTSWFLDQIGMIVPSSIILSEIQLQPLIKNIKEGEEILIHQNVIIIQGKSSNNNDFLNWIYNLEQLNWIEKVDIQKYGTGKKTTTEFELQMVIKK